MTKRLSLLALALFLICGTCMADTVAGTRKAVARSFRTTGGVEILSTSPMTVVTTAAVYTEAMNIEDSEYQSIDVTISSTNSITTTYMIQYTVADGGEKDGSEVAWRDLDATGVAITESYGDTESVNLPVCSAIRLKFNPDADGTANEYSVTHCVIGRW